MTDLGVKPELWEQLYRTELLCNARRLLRSARGRASIQPESLVHGAYLRLERAGTTFEDVESMVRLFLAAMRSELVDRRRQEGAAKRGGGSIRVPLEQAHERCATEREHTIEQLDLLLRLSKVDRDCAHVAILRFVHGWTCAAIAVETGLSLRTVERCIRFAKDWLKAHME